MLNKDCLYQPDKTEPSIFNGIPRSISLDWVCWFVHYKKTGIKTTDYSVDTDSVFTEKSNPALFAEVYQTAVNTYDRITHTLKEHPSEYILPEAPPKIYLPKVNPQRVRNVISMAWIMDTCIREQMDPQEACVLAYALIKM